jgi:hypothetical protein
MPNTSHGLRFPELSDDNNPPADIQALAEDVDGTYGANAANPAALPISGDFAGQRVWLVDRKGYAVWTGTGWDIDTPPTTAGITLGSGFTTVAEGTKVSKIAGEVTLRLAAQKATIGASDVIVNVPAGFRPPAGEVYRLSGSFNAVGRYATVNPSGDVTMDAATTGGIVGTVSYPCARP